jgi:hypothetical protein
MHAIRRGRYRPTGLGEIGIATPVSRTRSSADRRRLPPFTPERVLETLKA